MEEENKMKNLISYEEFKGNKSETSNYRIPFAAVEPPQNDKVWKYVKKEINKSPLWGIDAKNQESINRKKGDR